MKKNLCILALFLLISGDLAFAGALGGMDPGAINSQYMRDIRNYEIKSRAKDRSAIVKQSEESEQAQQAAETSLIKSVKFIGNNNFPSSQLLPIIQDKINQPMTAENLAAIKKIIMKFYQSEGYYSALPIIVSQDTKNGEVVLEIQEGSKNSIILE